MCMDDNKKTTIKEKCILSMEGVGIKLSRLFNKDETSNYEYRSGVS